MRVWIVIAILVCAAGAAIAVYFLPERETEITRGVLGEEVRRTMTDFGPMVNDLKK
jgi:hypothetical protein